MSFLTRKYPFSQSSHWLRDSLAYGVFIWAIFWLLQPFGFSMYSGNKCLAAALFVIRTYHILLLCAIRMGNIEAFVPTNKALAHLA